MSLSLAFLALGDQPQVSGAAIARDLAATWPALPTATEMAVQKHGAICFSIGDAQVALGLMPTPIPWTDLEGPCATSWLWPKAAEELKPHKQHLIAAVHGEQPPVAQAKLLTQVVAAVLATCPQSIGVYWGSATLVIPRDLFREFAVDILPDDLPLPIWVDFRADRGKNGKISGFTHGMKSLGHMEFETLNSPESPGDLRERLMDLCGYVLQNGPVIQNGHTVGQNANEKIRVVFSPSAFGREGQVMRLDYSSLGDKPWWKVW